MKFRATILTDGIGEDGEMIDPLGVCADTYIALSQRFSALRKDVIGYASLSSITLNAVRIDGTIDDGTPGLLRFADRQHPPELYAAPSGVVEASEMRDGVRVITKFRIQEISLTTHHADPHVPPIEVNND